tara:strand:+ start:1153 stop:1890 length:738 start_codon:yes stop_codon:yes gene_type:complete
MDKTIGVLGYGEIGKSIEEVYKKSKNKYKVQIRDLDRDNFKDVDILNVCIPGSEKFIPVVTEVIREFHPELTIIHSSVMPNTTLSVQNLIPSECCVVHSPVRGVHPNLYKGLKTFVKYIGSDYRICGEKANEHLTELGLKTKVVERSATTELAKLMSTSYYGVVIAWHQEMKDMCDYYNVDFEDAATHWNTTYNEGYTELGSPQFVRPVLYPPGKKIGGHCVTPNADLLKTEFESDALDLILKYK